MRVGVADWSRLENEAAGTLVSYDRMKMRCMNACTGETAERRPRGGTEGTRRARRADAPAGHAPRPGRAPYPGPEAYGKSS